MTEDRDEALAAIAKPRGRHPGTRLTVVRVKALKTPGRYADGNGLYLVIDPSGAKRWIWRGKIHGKRCDAGLGIVKSVALIDARDQAAQFRREARVGKDPLGD